MKLKFISLAILLSLTTVLGSCSVYGRKANDEVEVLPKATLAEKVEVAEAVWAHTVQPAGTKAGASSVISADLIYRTDTIEGIASVADIIVIGRFINVKSAVEGSNGYKSIITRGTLIVSEVLVGKVSDQIEVLMNGGTVAYQEISKLYTEEELEKYGIDPNTETYETFSQSFENMAIFDEGMEYLLTLSSGEDGTYYLSPSLYSLCNLSDTNTELKENHSNGLSFEIDQYVEAFKNFKR